MVTVMRYRLLTPLLILLAGCSVNPVTGDRELILVSSQQELAMGAQNYVPMQQSQGGAYKADPELNAYVRAGMLAPRGEAASHAGYRRWRRSLSGP